MNTIKENAKKNNWTLCEIVEDSLISFKLAAEIVKDANHSPKQV